MTKSISALFSTVADAGYGLALWLGVSASLLLIRNGRIDSLLSWQRPVLLAALVLSIATLGVAGWSNARSRHRILAISVLCTLWLAGMVLWLGLNGTPVSGAALPAAVVLSVAAAVGPMANAPLAPVAGRLTPILIPMSLGLALLSGAGLLFGVLAWKWPGRHIALLPAPALLMLIAIATAMLLLWWREHGGMFPCKQYLLRWLSLELIVFMPLVMIAIVGMWPKHAHEAWLLTAFSILAGIVLLRYRLSVEAD